MEQELFAVGGESTSSSISGSSPRRGCSTSTCFRLEACSTAGRRRRYRHGDSLTRCQRVVPLSISTAKSKTLGLREIGHLEARADQGLRHHTEVRRRDPVGVAQLTGRARDDGDADPIRRLPNLPVDLKHLGDCGKWTITLPHQTTWHSRSPWAVIHEDDPLHSSRRQLSTGTWTWGS